MYQSRSYFGFIEQLFAVCNLRFKKGKLCGGRCHAAGMRHLRFVTRLYIHHTLTLGNTSYTDVRSVSTS